jgi:hypothetical protein
MHDHGMHQPMTSDPATQDPARIPFWRTRSALVLGGFLAIAGFYLITEHTAHVFGVLPYLLILACPLMHLFMHHGHGDHQPQGSENRPQARLPDNDQANRSP